MLASKIIGFYTEYVNGEQRPGYYSAHAQELNLRILRMSEGTFSLDATQIQSNLNGSNIFGTMEIRSRHWWFEPLRVNHGTGSGSK